MVINKHLRNNTFLKIPDEISFMMLIILLTTLSNKKYNSSANLMLLISHYSLNVELCQSRHGPST